MLKRSQAPRGAFTLIEMLVVIGIIALLAAIMFPVFAKVRENGRKTACNSNLHQLGLAFQQYAQDFGGRYPFAGNYQVWAGTGPDFKPAAWMGATAHWITGGDASGPKNFTDGEKGLADSAPPSGTNTDAFPYVDGHVAYVEKGALFSYVKSATTYVCPSVPDGDKKKLTYSMNCAVGGLSTVRIRVPAEIVLLVDEGKSLNDGYFWSNTNAASTDSLFDGHNGSGNLLFADGHVKSRLTKEFPLDWSTQGLANKTALTGQVRFRDAAFGFKGANLAPSRSQNTCGDAISTTP